MKHDQPPAHRQRCHAKRSTLRQAKLISDGPRRRGAPRSKTAIPKHGLLARKDGGTPVKIKRITTFRWKNMECFTHRGGRIGTFYKFRDWVVTHARTGVALTLPGCPTEAVAILEARTTLSHRYKDLAHFETLRGAP